MLNATATATAAVKAAQEAQQEFLAEQAKAVKNACLFPDSFYAAGKKAQDAGNAAEAANEAAATADRAERFAQEAQQEFLAEQAKAVKNGGFFPDSFYDAGKKARDAAKAAEAANEA